ncbi:MAG: hypothetical protein R3B57_05480 [Phycisphaerales bacterium]
MHARRTLAFAILLPLFACASAPNAGRTLPTGGADRPTDKPAESSSKPSDAPDSPDAIRPEDIAVFWPLGSTDVATADNPLRQGFGVQKPGGFDEWVTKSVRPLYDRGFRLLIVHNPLGNDPDSKSMDLDQAYDAREKDRSWNITQFDDALERIGREMPGMRVVVYIGTRENDLTRALDEGRFRDHLVRAASMFLLTRILDYKHVTIAFDAASNYEDDSPERALVDMVRAYKRRQGQEVYVEPLPLRSWEKDYAWVTLERYYKTHTQQAARLKSPGAIRVFTAPPDFDAWNSDGWAWLTDCVRQGHTPALGWNLDAKESAWRGMTAAQIAARANALAARPASRP